MMAARDYLVDDERFVFARRVVTRSGSLAEDHDSLSEDDFIAASERGDFLLHWSAHGLHYGLPMVLSDALNAGRHVIANISRGAIFDAERVCRKVIVLNVTADPQIRAARMANRGRESEAAILARLSREAPLKANHAQIIDIENNGEIADANAKFIATLQGL